jgi:hypothetical protein
VDQLQHFGETSGGRHERALPTRNLPGTDTFEYSASLIIECPYTGKNFKVYYVRRKQYPEKKLTSRLIKYCHLNH